MFVLITIGSCGLGLNLGFFWYCLGLDLVNVPMSLFYNAVFLMLFNQLYFYYVDFSSSGSGAASYTGLCFVILLSSRTSYLLLSFACL